jgi:hypothetical protein
LTRGRGLAYHKKVNLIICKSKGAATPVSEGWGSAFSRRKGLQDNVSDNNATAFLLAQQNFAESNEEEFLWRKIF